MVHCRAQPASIEAGNTAMKLGIFTPCYWDKLSSSAASQLVAESALGSAGDYTTFSLANRHRCSPKKALNHHFPMVAVVPGKPHACLLKPPYANIALIAMVIRGSTGGCLTLAKINE